MFVLSSSAHVSVANTSKYQSLILTFCPIDRDSDFLITMETDSLTTYGKRLIPEVLDRLADSDPNRVYAAIPKTSDVNDGYRDITVGDLARCVDFMAKWIEERFGRSDNFETITYIGLSDLRGPATLLAAIKTGYKVWIISSVILSSLTPTASSANASKSSFHQFVADESDGEYQVTLYYGA